MINKRLTKIAQMVPKGKIILDIGTDHALLPIYLIKNEICPKVIASDISTNALNYAKENIKKYNVNNISLYLSDGLKDIKEKYDIITISGMGTNTILDILNTDNLPDTLVLSTNNDLALLRKEMNKKGYKIAKEEVVYERNKYYDIILYEKGSEHLSYFEIAYGKSNDLDYLNHLYKIEKKISSVAPLKKRIMMRPYIHMLKRFIEKKTVN